MKWPKSTCTEGASFIHKMLEMLEKCAKIFKVLITGFNYKGSKELRPLKI